MKKKGGGGICMFCLSNPIGGATALQPIYYICIYMHPFCLTYDRPGSVEFHSFVFYCNIVYKLILLTPASALD